MTKTLSLASWNVNSIRTRLDHVLNWLKNTDTDILMMQELKCTNEQFPIAAFEEAGYHCLINGQKTWNGVAIVSKEPLKLISNALYDDEQARFLEVETEEGLRLIDIYLPNGNPVDSEKYPYKLEWMTHLKKHLQGLLDAGIPFIIGGDWNVIPEDKDCHDPAAWEGDALFRLETHKKFQEILNLGLTDAFRAFNTDAEQYTFWDYQAGAWQRNNGIRIDHFLLSPPMADRTLNCAIDKEPRALEKPSDHVPIVVTIQQ